MIGPSAFGVGDACVVVIGWMICSTFTATDSISKSNLVVSVFAGVVTFLGIDGFLEEVKGGGCIFVVRIDDVLVVADNVTTDGFSFVILLLWLDKVDFLAAVGLVVAERDWLVVDVVELLGFKGCFLMGTTLFALVFLEEISTTVDLATDFCWALDLFHSSNFANLSCCI